MLELSKIDIKHIATLADLDSNAELFKQLYEEGMQKYGGVFGSIWTNPIRYIYEEAYISLGYVEDVLASLMFIAKNQWFGWEEVYTNLYDTYGLIGFYTKPQFRNNGLAKKVFNKFDNDVHIRKLSSSDGANNVISSVKETEKVIFFS